MGCRLGSGRLAATLLCMLCALPASAQTTRLEETLREAVDELKAGQYDVAIERLRRLERETPDNPAVQFYLAEALLSAGRPEDASRALVRFYKAYGGKSPEAIEPYLVLVPRSADIADRIYGWNQPDETDEASGGVADVLLGGLIVSGATALALGAVAGVAAANVGEIQNPLSRETDPEASRDVVEWEQTQRVAGLSAAISAVVAVGCGVAYLIADDEPTVDVQPTVDRGGDVAGARMSIGWRF